MVKKGSVLQGWGGYWLATEAPWDAGGAVGLVVRALPLKKEAMGPLHVPGAGSFRRVSDETEAVRMRDLRHLGDVS